MANTLQNAVTTPQGDEDEAGSLEKFDDFPEDFNQLELLKTHGHLIPTGTQSLWPGDSDEDNEERTEEWYLTEEKKLQDNPQELILFAAENDRERMNKMLDKLWYYWGSINKGPPVYLMSGKQHEQLGTVQGLLSDKPDLVNTADEDHYTPLHRASYNGHLGIVRELVARGADVHAVTVDWWTPLHSACKWNNTSVASFLLQHGADINAQTKGLLTPLHLASGNRDSRQMLELLLMNRYIKPNLRNKAGETAYEIARRTDVYHYLFEIADYWIRPSSDP